MYIDRGIRDASDYVAAQQATAQLNKEYYKKAACIPALASIIASSPEQPVSNLLSGNCSA